MKSSHPLITFSIYNTDNSLHESPSVNSIDIYSIVSKYPLGVRLSDSEAESLYMEIFNLHKSKEEAYPDTMFWNYVCSFLDYFKPYFVSKDSGYVIVSVKDI